MLYCLHPLGGLFILMFKLVLLFLLLLPHTPAPQPIQSPPVETPKVVEAPQPQPAPAVPEPAPTPPPPPPPPPPPKPTFSYAGGALSPAQINFLGNCESGMRANTNTGNGYYGAFQFSIPTWNAMGTGYSRADLAPLDVQIMAVQKLLSRSSIFSQFPGCANKMRQAGMI